MADCIQCGYCCTVRACPYGEWDDTTGRCIFLTEVNLCSIHDWIMEQPGSDMSPAFGAGCSSPLFNEVRARKAKQDGLQGGL
jgi:hypothetical protein